MTHKLIVLYNVLPLEVRANPYRSADDSGLRRAVQLLERVV